LDDVTVTHVPPLAFKAATQSAGMFDLTWVTATGLVYQVQYKTNLLQANWLNLTKPILATNSTLTVSDSGSAPQRFYRLVISP